MSAETTMPEPITPGDTRQPYPVFSLMGPARKDGVPVMGNFGARPEHWVIMTAETFKRLVRENQNLATARFEVATYDD